MDTVCIRFGDFAKSVEKYDYMIEGIFKSPRPIYKAGILQLFFPTFSKIMHMH